MSFEERRVDSPARDGWVRLRRGIESRAVRVVLALAIIISLLPYHTVEVVLAPLLLALFGAEFLLRVILLFKGHVARPKTEAGFLVIDFVALLSFLPAAWLGIPPELLRAARLARLVVLARFTRALARDVYRVLTRREQVQQLLFVTGAVAGLSFVSAVLLHNLRVPGLVEGGGFWDRMWWAFRQVESPDNLVPSLDAHPGFVALSLTLTIVGIFVFSYLIGLGTTIVEQVLAAEKRRPVEYEGHTLIAGPVHNSESMVEEFVRIYEKNRALRRIRPREVWRWLRGIDPRPRRHALPRITLLGESEELPSFLYEAHMRWVVHRHGQANDRDSLLRAGAPGAKRAILLASDGSDADARTISALAAFRGMNPAADAFVEVRESSHASVAEAVGGPGTFVLDGPRFVGLFIAHHLTVPAAADVFAELMSADGNEMYTHLYADAEEHQAMRGLDNRALSVKELAQRMHEKHGVTLVGAFVADELAQRRDHELVSVSHLESVMNPHAPGSEHTVRADRLQGVFGLAPTYLPLRRAARSLWTATELESVQADDRRCADVVFGSQDLYDGPSRVLIVGQNQSIDALVMALAKFVPGVRVHLLVKDGDATRLRLEGELEGEGHCKVREAEDLALAASQAIVDSTEALVFLASRDAAPRDLDATTELRVLRFVRAFLGSEKSERATPLTMLVEVDELRRGQTLKANVERLSNGRIEVTPVSTSEITNYFLVHSAFVPGVMGLYEQLLGERGADLGFVSANATDAAGEVSAAAIRDHLMDRGCVFLGVKVGDEVRLNPQANERFAASKLRGAFVVADSSQKLRTLVHDQQDEQE